MLVTYEDIRNDESIKCYITEADKALSALGYTEHSFPHVVKAATMAEMILLTLNYPKRTAELAKIAGYMHDIGNIVNRIDHAQSGAVMAFRLLDRMGMDPADAQAGGGPEALLSAALQRALEGADGEAPAVPEGMGGGGGRAIERPPYNVRVQIQRRSPLQIQANNEFVLQVAQICGQAGQPLPPLAVVSLLQGIDNKQEVLAALREADQTRAQMTQLQQAVEQLQAQLSEANRKTEVLGKMTATMKAATGVRQAPGDMPQGEAAMVPAQSENTQLQVPDDMTQGEAAVPAQSADARMQALADALGGMQAGQV